MRSKINVKISNDFIYLTNEFIHDVYKIAQNQITKNFYIFSDNGYNSFDICEYKNLEDAIKNCKRVIRTYFECRCEDNPIGF